MVKSPFLVFQNAFPIKLCEQLSDFSSDSPDGMFAEEVKNTEVNAFTEGFLIDRIKSHYGSVVADYRVQMESYGVGHEPIHICDSAQFQNGVWYRNKDIDFVSIIFLKDQLEDVNETLDNGFEVYGGKLEFPTFNFGFAPERGTIVTFPAVPNFLNAISKIKIGQLNLLRIYHKSDNMFVYEPTQFQGDLNTWFADLH